MTFPGAANGMLPQPVDPRTLRPRRVWYVVAVAIGLIGIVVGVGLFGLGLASVFKGLPKITTEFDTGEPVTVHFTAAEKSAIYVDWSSRRRDQVDAECTGSAQGDGTIDLRPVSSSLDFQSGGRRWLTAYTVKVSRDGDYELSCKPSVSEGPTHYGVGDSPKIEGLVAKTLGGVAALAVAPGLGVTIGALIALVVALRRSSHRKRLQTGYPPPAPTETIRPTAQRE